MKYCLPVIFLALVLAMGCKQKENKMLKGENQQLLAEVMKKDSTINLLFQAFNEIEENLEIIKSKQNVISQNAKGSPELSPDVRDRINEDIKTINDLMDKNKKKLASLNRKLKEANLKIGEFQKAIERMTRQVEEKDNEINGLKDDLMKMNFKVEELNARIDTLQDETRRRDEIIESKTSELNTAYYVYGTRKELLEKGILSKSGFLGSQKKLVNDLNQTYFTKVDITKFSEIPLNVKSLKLLTTHSGSSYELRTNGKQIEKLVITNPAKFWEVSKYLVIEVETLK